VFITLEGPEGSGKTSHLPPLVEFLRERGYTVFPTREPGGTSIGEQIREVIHDLKNAEMHPRTETLLYQAARAQIVEEVFKPRLAVGEVVISDRYYDSTIAYQGYGHQQELDQVRALVRYATGGLVPDLTVLLDVDVETGLKRKTENGSEWNRLDAYTVEFHQRVRAGYLDMVRSEPARWVLIDASREWQAVQDDLRQVVLAKLEASS
jgi:dTMP kinase